MQEFGQGTMNSQIFRLTAPYDNPYQGSTERWLFVCSAGLLRSPTGAAMAIQRGFNARACGANLSYAVIPISTNLIMWAHKIVFVCSEVYDTSLELFRERPNMIRHLENKRIVLEIPDQYRYMEAELVEHFDRELFSKLDPTIV